MIYFNKLIDLYVQSSDNYIAFKTDHASCLTGYLWLEYSFPPVHYSPHILYLTSDTKSLQNVQIPPYTHFLIFSDQSISQIASCFSADMNFIVLPPEKKSSICPDLYHLFAENSYVSQFANVMLNSLFYENSIQTMIDEAYSVFGNPIFVFDADFNLIAANWKEGSRHAQGRKIIQNGGFSEEEFDMVNHLEHIHEKVKKSELPILAHHPEIGFDQLLCSINPQQDLGHIVVCGLNHAFTETDQKLLLLLRQAVDQQMKKNSFIKNNRGSYYEYLFKDILDGKITSDQQYNARANYLKTEFSRNLYCLVIEITRSSSTLNTMHIRKLFENKFHNSKTLLYHNDIIILIQLPEKDKITACEIQEISSICKENELYGGMSNSFRNILHLPEYYSQARCAVSLGTERSDLPSLFLYKDYYIQHIHNIFCQNESLHSFCHPALKILQDYDRENTSHLALSLYTYLVCERNITAAAEAMFIHRNTLIYRLKKINSIISFDYDDYRERQYLILSYELCNQ